MPVQDLTPQLRTRLSRVERAVGLFVSIATLLLLAGFAYYVYSTGERKGWWTFKARYYTYADSGAGLSVGGDVRLLGFSVGRIMKVEAMPPGVSPPVFLQFYVLHPYEGYIWSDSDVKVVAGDFLGGRVVEILPGGGSLKRNPTAKVHASYKTSERPYRIYNDDSGEYDVYTDASKGYHLIALESPAVTERLESIANQAQEALPGILDLTNRLNIVLSNVASLTLEAQTVLTDVRPALTNLSMITANLRDPKGSLGEWVLPTNLHTQLLRTLGSANDTLTNASRTLANTDTNITGIATNLDQTLINLANITSNLNQQVQNNTNLVKSLSDIITNANDMIEGLKHHWLLRSAFKNRDKDEKKRTDQETGPARETPLPKAGKWR
jgi:ABC-type transporter Mla subunit MlaD